MKKIFTVFLVVFFGWILLGKANAQTIKVGMPEDKVILMAEEAGAVEVAMDMYNAPGNHLIN